MNVISYCNLGWVKITDYERNASWKSDFQYGRGAQVKQRLVRIQKKRIHEVFKLMSIRFLPGFICMQFYFHFRPWINHLFIYQINKSDHLAELSINSWILCQQTLKDIQIISLNTFLSFSLVFVRLHCQYTVHYFVLV